MGSKYYLVQRRFLEANKHTFTPPLVAGHKRSAAIIILFYYVLFATNLNGVALKTLSIIQLTLFYTHRGYIFTGFLLY